MLLTVSSPREQDVAGGTVQPGAGREGLMARGPVGPSSPRSFEVLDHRRPSSQWVRREEKILQKQSRQDKPPLLPATVQQKLHHYTHFTGGQTEAQGPSSLVEITQLTPETEPNR